MIADLSRDLALALDPVRFAEAAGLEPDPWQCEVLRSTAPRLLLNCSRQSGKSTVSAVLGMHAALYTTPAPLVIILSPSERQSKELFRKLLDVNRAIGQPVPAAAETKLTLELDNGARVVALPSNEAGIRGFSGVGLLLVDESSRVPDDLYRAIRPMLAVSGGRLVALSTPFGRRGWWYEAWVGDGDWHRVEVRAEQCPRITPQFLAEERAALGDLWFSQEYGCAFVDLTTQVFASELVAAAVSTDVKPLFGGPHHA